LCYKRREGHIHNTQVGLLVAVDVAGKNLPHPLSKRRALFPASCTFDLMEEFTILMDFVLFCSLRDPRIVGVGKRDFSWFLISL